MNFLHPSLLLGIPIIVLGVLVWFRSRGASSIADGLESATKLWADGRGLAPRPSRLGFSTGGALLAVGLALVLAALARPQWGAVEETSYDQAREVVLALDLSRSMTASDVKPTRLDRSKLLIESLLDELRGERVGLIVFAGTGFLQSPLSADYEVMRDLLPALDPSYLPQGGTNYAAVLEAGLEAFRSDAKGDRFLVILSDGEAHDDRWEDLVPRLRDEGIRVIGIGVGTPEGALLEDGQGGLMKDERGAAVLSKLEPSTLERLARETGGRYVGGARWVDLAGLVEDTVGQGFQGEFVEEKQLRRQEQFQWFLAPAIALLLLAFWRELPVVASARQLPVRTQPRRGAVRGAPGRAARTAVGLGALLLLLNPEPARAQPAAPSVPGPPPHGQPMQAAAPDLRAAVAELAAKPELAAGDYADLAETTIGFASAPTAPQGEVRVAVIDDALRGVREGERLDAEAADWPKLRETLLELREPPPQDPSQQQPQNSSDESDESDESEESDESKDQDTQSSDSGSSGEQSQGEGSQSESSSADEPAGDGSQDESDASQDEGDRPAGSSEDPGRSEPGEDPSGDEDPSDDSSGSGDAPEERSDYDSESARLGDLAEPEEPQDEPAEGGSSEDGETAPSPETPETPETRMVGGGNGRSTDLEARPELAAALSRMEQVRNQDAPGVLFQRMGEQEGTPPSQDQGRNW